MFPPEQWKTSHVSNTLFSINLIKSRVLQNRESIDMDRYGGGTFIWNAHMLSCIYFPLYYILERHVLFENIYNVDIQKKVRKKGTKKPDYIMDVSFKHKFYLHVKRKFFKIETPVNVYNVENSGE